MPIIFSLWLTSTPAGPAPLPPPQLVCEELRVELKRGVRNLYISRKDARNIYQRCLRSAYHY